MVKIGAITATIQKTLTNFTSLQISNNLMSPSEAAFELGNDGTWPDIEPFIAHGTKYRIILNGSERLTGRVEAQDLPIDSAGGSVVRFTVRTKLADAMYASANPGISLKDSSVKDFLLAVYEPLEYAEADFIFKPADARDILTQQDTQGKGSPIEVDPGAIIEKRLKVNPPETIYEAADRVLRRHGLIHWDSPDGKIVVGAPNDTQRPQYSLNCHRWPSPSQGNNVLGFTVTRDWSGVPSQVTATGTVFAKGKSRKRVSAIEVEPEVGLAGFYRPIIIQTEGLRTANKVQHAAVRELAARRKNMDAIGVQLDSLSYWDGQQNRNWGVDSVVQVLSNVAGGPIGAYFIHQVTCRRDANNGDTTNLQLLRKGLWVL
jgi:prophage tail gpP-like protein